MKDLVFCYTFSMKTMKFMVWLRFSALEAPPKYEQHRQMSSACPGVEVASHFSRFHWFHKGFAIYFQEKTIKINVLHNCCAKTNLHVCKLDLVMSWSITCINWPQQITWFACCQNIETCVKGNHVKVFVTTKGGGSPENCPTQGSSTESSQENMPIIWSHVNWCMLLSSDPMSLAHPSLWLKQLSKTMGSLTRHPPKTNNKDTIQKKSPTSPGGSFMKIVLANT